MHSVGPLLASVLPALLARAPLTPEKVEFAWRTSVGPGLGRVTSARIDDQGTLVITAQDPQWKREVERSFALIRSRLDALLGPDAFIKVEIIHG